MCKKPVPGRVQKITSEDLVMSFFGAKTNCVVFLFFSGVVLCVFSLQIFSAEVPEVVARVVIVIGNCFVVYCILCFDFNYFTFSNALSEAEVGVITNNCVFCIRVLYLIDFEFAVLCFLLLCPRQ